MNCTFLKKLMKINSSVYLFVLICLILVIDLNAKKSKKKKLLSKPALLAYQNEKISINKEKKKEKVKKEKSKSKTSKSDLKSKFSLVDSKSNLFLFKESKYNKRYLKEYKKMITSLLRGNLSNLIDSSFLRKSSEEITSNSRYIKKTVPIRACTPSELKSWKEERVLQCEDNNCVTLRRNELGGKKVVEKSMVDRKHLDRELDFFRHLNSTDTSSHYFAKIVCTADTPKREKRFSLVTEYIEGETSQYKAAKASKSQLVFMVAQFFNSLIEMHKIGYIHTDIKPNNIMVTNDYKVKLIDFGMAKRVGQATGFRGSSYTRAPELHEFVPGKIDVAIDWWAFGSTVAIWYYYHHFPKYADKKFLEFETKKLGLNRIHLFPFTPMKYNKKFFVAGEFPDCFDDTLRKFLAMFLTIDPELREFNTVRLQNLVRNHEYFKDFDWSTII